MDRSKKQPKDQLVDLTPEEVKSLLHPREGFEPFAAELAALYRANLDTLRIQGLDPDAIVAEADAYTALEETERQAQQYLAMVQKTRLLHASNSWGGMLKVYDRARSVGNTDAVMKRGIARFAAFMKNGPRKKRAAVTPTAG